MDRGWWKRLRSSDLEVVSTGIQFGWRGQDWGSLWTARKTVDSGHGAGVMCGRCGKIQGKNRVVGWRVNVYRSRAFQQPCLPPSSPTRENLMRPFSNSWKLLLAVFLVLAITQLLSAQANRASITGTVTDTSGAIVPGVEATATNVATNVATKTVSNNDGIYVIPNLFPGEYAVEFKREGFEVLKVPNVMLVSTQVARIDASLKVGAITESVT